MRRISRQIWRSEISTATEFRTLAITNDDSSNVTILLGNGSGGIYARATESFCRGNESNVKVAVGDFQW